jgi:hypothetical protein
MISAPSVPVRGKRSFMPSAASAVVVKKADAPSNKHRETSPEINEKFMVLNGVTGWGVECWL